MWYAPVDSRPLCKYILHRKQFVKKQFFNAHTRNFKKYVFTYFYFSKIIHWSQIFGHSSHDLWITLLQSRSKNHFYKVNKCNSFFSKTYTLKSDIWSFGVVLWEMMSLGANPYSDLTVDQHFVFLRDKKRLQRPPNCSQVKLVK